MTSRESSLSPVCASYGPDGAFAREVLDQVGDKWTLLIITSLAGGARRFTQIQRDTGGISQRMLTLNLRNLQRDGMLTRTAYPEVPPRVEYELTDLGRSLLEPVEGLLAWAAVHAAEVKAHRAAVDSAAAAS
nr:helix-turn-helix domain-containing protein [Streptomyces sp. TS71-3]